MLQDKYGRLAMIGAIVVIVVILIIAPGMNSKKKPKTNNQLNIPNKVAESVEADVSDNQVKPSEPVPIPRPVEQRTVSAEDRLLDSWGLNQKTEEKRDVDTSDNDAVKSIAKPDNMTPSAEPLNSDKPVPNIHEQNLNNGLEGLPKPDIGRLNKDVISVNGKCYARPVQAPSITQSECVDTASNLGIRGCIADPSGSDYWGGAVKACGGVSKLPDMDDLVALSKLLYNTQKVDIPSASKANFAPYGSYKSDDSEQRGGYNFSFKDVSYDTAKAQELGFPNSPDYEIWGKAELSPSNASSVSLKPEGLFYKGRTDKKTANGFVMCSVPCN